MRKKADYIYTTYFSLYWKNVDCVDHKRDYKFEMLKSFGHFLRLDAFGIQLKEKKKFRDFSIKPK